MELVKVRKYDITLKTSNSLYNIIRKPEIQINEVVMLVLVVI